MKNTKEMKNTKNAQGAAMKKPMLPKGAGAASIKRLLKMLFTEYRRSLVLVIVFIIITSAASTIASLFMSFFIEQIGIGLDKGWDAVKGAIFTAL